MAQIDFNFIKTLAKDTGLRVTDLIALSPQNDPHYMGTPGDWIKARWFKKVWDMGGYSQGAHLRRIHYFCVSYPGMTTFAGQPYLNTTKCWQELAQCAKIARYLKLVKVSDIADHKNPNPIVYAPLYEQREPHYEIELPDPAVPIVNISGIYNSHAQPYLIEIWCEKSTMNDVLEPLAEKYYANLCTFEGEASLTACYNLMARIYHRRKPARVLYISDYDPAGNSMPKATSRKLEWLLQQYHIDQDVKVKHIALTGAQVDEYDLPTTPIKESELRGKSFMENQGRDGAVELDALEALHPGVLHDLVEAEIEPYYDEDIAYDVGNQIAALETDLQDYVDTVTGEYAEHVAKVREMQEKIKTGVVEKVRASDYEVPLGYKPVDENEDDWLFSSERDYIEQIAAYHRHKTGDSNGASE